MEVVISQRYTKEVIPLVVNTSRSFSHSWLVTGFVTRKNMTSATSWTGAPEFIPIFSEVHVTRSLVLNVWFVDRCLSFFFVIVLLSFFDLRILITPLVSSNTFIVYRDFTFLRVSVIFPLFHTKYQRLIKCWSLLQVTIISHG